MSQNRGRKKRSRNGHRPAAASGVNRVIARVMRDCRQLVKTDDPFEAEGIVSQVLGASWRGRASTDVLIEHAARKPNPLALALLRVLEVLAGPGERQQAAEAAASLAGRGVPDPGWAGAVGHVDVGQCWAQTDVYDEETALLCTFAYGDRWHALEALIDQGDARLEHLSFIREPDAALDELREESDSEPTVSLQPIEPAEARRLLERAIEADNDQFPEVRALALARIRALPEPSGPRDEPTEVDAAERAAIVADFLASAHGRALPRGEKGVEQCARLIVDYGCDHDNSRPLRVSPMKTEAFLLDWLPRTVTLEPEDRAAMPAVMSAWVRWAAERNQLPPEAIGEVTEQADEVGTLFASMGDDLSGPGPGGELSSLGPGAWLLQKLVDQIGHPHSQEDLVRRLFVTPSDSCRIGDEDFTDLDPNDPDQRRLLIEGEHPEYHEALRTETFGAEPTEIDGVNPALHIALHEVVANQLWDDDPPEAWQAALELMDLGLDRHDILHMLGEVTARYIHATLTEERPLDAKAFRKDLAALPEAIMVTARPAAEESDHDVATIYQLKVTLVGVEPPIWRRLRVPGEATLADLHVVLQTAMGWSDEHLHEFAVGRRRFGQRHPHRPVEVLDEGATRLREAVPFTGGRLIYRYDFGDDWEHEILVEDILIDETAGMAVRFAECAGGERACPPEDCGGPWGYYQLCERIDKGLGLESFGLEDFDPDAFDTEFVNAKLRRIPGATPLT